VSFRHREIGSGRCHMIFDSGRFSLRCACCGPFVNSRMIQRPVLWRTNWLSQPLLLERTWKRLTVLIVRAAILDDDEFAALEQEGDEIVRILSAIIFSANKS